LAAPERSETTEDELAMAYDNAEAETILSDTNTEALKMTKKKKKVT
jgi:hypothetical protein